MFITAPRGSSLNARGDDGSGERSTTARDTNSHRKRPECLWMDVDSNAVGTHSFSDMKLARVHGHWLVKGIRVGKIEKL